VATVDKWSLYEGGRELTIDRIFLTVILTIIPRPKGIIVGGLDRGFISVYDADKLIKGQEGNLIFSKDKHTGPVTALDFNPFQVNIPSLSFDDN
jgi:hypothetical protein